MNDDNRFATKIDLKNELSVVRDEILNVIRDLIDRIDERFDEVDERFNRIEKMKNHKAATIILTTMKYPR